MSTPACWSWPVPTSLDLSNPRMTLKSWHEGRCAICGVETPHFPPPGPRLGPNEDHDHATGMIRGWLCRGCNAQEGQPRNVEHPLFVKYRERPPAAILNIWTEYPARRRIARSRTKRTAPAGVVVTTVRFPPEGDLRQRVTTAAARDRRTFNSEVVALLEAALDIRDRAKAARR